MGASMVFNQFWPFIQHCHLCQTEAARPHTVLCEGCHQDLPWRLDTMQLDQTDIQVLFDYAWPVDRLLHLFKYQQRLELLPIFRHALQQHSRIDVDAIVAMPCSAARLRQRGYNQAHLLAQQLSVLWQIPLWPHLQRVQQHAAQQRLDRAERLSNLQDAFAVSASQQPPARILLLDDVLTTGASFCSAADCLRRAGAIHIEGLIIASHHPATPQFDTAQPVTQASADSTDFSSSDDGRTAN